MPSVTRHRTLSSKEALEYIAYAVWQRDVPDDFDGEITCELNDDGSVEVYALSPDDSEDNPLN